MLYRHHNNNSSLINGFFNNATIRILTWLYFVISYITYYDFIQYEICDNWVGQILYLIHKSWLHKKYWPTIYRDLSPIQLSVVSKPIEDFWRLLNALSYHMRIGTSNAYLHSCAHTWTNTYKRIFHACGPYLFDTFPIYL